MFGLFKKKRQGAQFVNGCVYHCLGKNCPQWVSLTLNYKDAKTGEPIVREEGKCAAAWIPTLLIEIRDKIK